MRKLFLLIPALVLSLVINAAVININTETADALRKALNSATDGDIIEMAAGTYVESPENWIAFTGKNITVRAAEGAEVILQPQVSIRLKEGATAEFIGIKFDCGHLSDVNAYSDIIFPADATDGKNIILRNCEFYGWTQNNAIIYSASSNTLNSLIIENCYFHDVTKSCVFLENTTNAVDVQISNSTFANIATVTSSYWAGVIDMRSTTGSLRVDHCTFYNVQAMNTDYAAIGKIGSGTTAVVSNCIFAMPASTSGVRTIRDAVTANSCLVYNYSSDSGYGMQSNVTKTNCVIANPLFTDAANGDYSFAGDWTTMNISPARGAATDGSDLGDPRWYSAETLPSTVFAPSYVFLGAKAQLSGSFALNGDNYIQSQNKTYAGLAVWKIQATRKCIVDVTLNIADANTSGHRYEVALYDANNVLVGTALAEPSNSWSAGDKVLGSFEIPAAGNYTVKLTNDCEYSSTILEGLTFAYVGGALQAMPGTTDIDDAWFSSNGTRADGKISYTSIGSGCWAKWNINVAAAGTYNVTVNISGQYGHKYVVEFLKEGESTPIVVTKGTTNYDNDPTLYANELGSVILEAANYEMKVFNDVGDAALHSVKLEYAGGGVQNMPGTTELMEAWFSSNGTRNNGAIEYTSVSSGCWAKWNLAFAKGGNFNVIVNIRGQYGHQYVVEFLKEGESTPIVVTKGTTNYDNDPTLYANELGMVTLEAGNYEMKVSNNVGDAALISVTLEYLGGARATLPASCTFADLMLSPKAQIYDNMLYFEEPGDHNPVGQWAKWNVKVAEAGTFLFTMNVTSPNSQSYKISILDMEENELDAFESGSLGTGDNTVKHYFNLAAGNYIVKLENTYPWSQGHIVSLAVTQPELLVLDEAAEDNSVIVANYRNGNHDIQIIRSITPGMYNTICLPFDVAKAQLKAVFGSDVELLKMSAATLSGNELNLNFADALEGGIYRGTPYLIKTSKAIVNPVFTAVEIKAEEGSATGGEGFAADFIGNFIKSEVPAGDQNLFLMQDNELFFRQTATPIKGMRAYFHVNVPGAAQAIQRIRIEEAPAITTGINRVEANGSVKAIENGQLVIIKNGVKYNVMGIKLQ